MKFLLPLLFFLLLAGCVNNTTAPEASASEAPPIPTINYTVEATFPHDTTAFTEGLLIHEGSLFESTGAPSELPQTHSAMGIIDLKTGHAATKAEMDKSKYFAEGISFLNGKLYWLTYQTKLGFIYDAKTFRQTGQFSFPSKEGWGMTTDGKWLIMSDGTSRLTYLDPSGLVVHKVLTVSDNNGPVNNLNELELIGAHIYANIYTTNQIIKIDTATGNVLARLDLSSLAQDAKARYPGALEMNGIAFDPANKSVYVTGKMWPTLYEIKFQY